MAAPAQARTRVFTYSPFTAGGSVSPDLSVTPRSGDCWTTPEAPVAHLAYRCMAGNVIHDPCFEPPGGLDPAHPSVICVDAPWNPNVIRLHLTRTPDVKPARTANPRLPWAIGLTTGELCVFVQGATGLDTAHRRFNYVCGSSVHETRWLFGTVDRSHATWRIHGGRPSRSGGRYAAKAERSLAIRTAWR